jgi:RNA polymerase sigma-70 factor (ECF subfamily)
MRVALRDSHDAEELTQTAFANAFEALPRYERTERPFRSWLFTIVRNVAVSSLRTQGRVEPIDPVDLDERREAEAEPEDLRALTWVSDRDLLVLIERLPAVQRQVITLRFMFGLHIREIAELLETTPNHASVLQYRALGFLRQRLAAAGREPQAAPRVRTQRCIRQARVLRRRRFALSP